MTLSYKEFFESTNTFFFFLKSKDKISNESEQSQNRKLKAILIN